MSLNTPTLASSPELQLVNNDKQDRAIERVLKRAEISKKTRRLQQRLALASFKTMMGMENIGFDKLEEYFNEKAAREARVREIQKSRSSSLNSSTSTNTSNNLNNSTNTSINTNATTTTNVNATATVANIINSNSRRYRQGSINNTNIPNQYNNTARYTSQSQAQAQLQLKRQQQQQQQQPLYPPSMSLYDTFMSPNLNSLGSPQQASSSSSTSLSVKRQSSSSSSAMANTPYFQYPSYFPQIQQPRNPYQARSIDLSRRKNTHQPQQHQHQHHQSQPYHHIPHHRNNHHHHHNSWSTSPVTTTGTNTTNAYNIPASPVSNARDDHGPNRRHSSRRSSSRKSASTSPVISTSNKLPSGTTSTPNQNGPECVDAANVLTSLTHPSSSASKRSGKAPAKRGRPPSSSTRQLKPHSSSSSSSSQQTIFKPSTSGTSKQQQQQQQQEPPSTPPKQHRSSGHHNVNNNNNNNNNNGDDDDEPERENAAQLMLFLAHSPSPGQAKSPERRQQAQDLSLSNAFQGRQLFADDDNNNNRTLSHDDKKPFSTHNMDNLIQSPNASANADMSSIFKPPDAQDESDDHQPGTGNSNKRRKTSVSNQELSKMFDFYSFTNNILGE